MPIKCKHRNFQPSHSLIVLTKIQPIFCWGELGPGVADKRGGGGLHYATANYNLHRFSLNHNMHIIFYEHTFIGRDATTWKYIRRRAFTQNVKILLIYFQLVIPTNESLQVHLIGTAYTGKDSPILCFTLSNARLHYFIQCQLILLINRWILGITALLQTLC